jgi:hypothetical protein
MEKDTKMNGVIENWSIVGIGNCKVIQGEISKSKKFEDCTHITTSPIEDITVGEVNTLGGASFPIAIDVTTKSGSVYILGKMEEGFQNYLDENDFTISDYSKS